MDDDELDVEEIMSCTPIDIQLGFASPLAHVGNLFQFIPKAPQKDDIGVLNNFMGLCPT